MGKNTIKIKQYIKKSYLILQEVLISFLVKILW